MRPMSKMLEKEGMTHKRRSEEGLQGRAPEEGGLGEGSLEIDGKQICKVQGQGVERVDCFNLTVSASSAITLA